MKFSFFALAFRMKYITRWGLMRNYRTENLSEHSAETAMLAHSLALIGNQYFHKHYLVERVAVLALYHDLCEVFTGDLPTPVKYFNSEMRESYKKIEESAAQKLLLKLPDELRDEYADILNEHKEKDLHILVKAADKLCAYIKCTEEVSNGNNEFKKALVATKKSLDQYPCEELQYFMEHFLPSFNLTLDEL